mgnify:CR=1 FL=1
MSDGKSVLENMYDKLDHFLKTETVIGEPIKLENITLIPIITASFGLGGGFGEESDKNASGSGGGLGCRISPDAVLVVKGDHVEMLPVKTKHSLEKIIDKVPEILEKLDSKKEKSDDDD